MDSSQSDKRKFRCLVTSLKRERITSVDQLEERHGPILDGCSFALVIKAIETARGELNPKWKKQIEQLIKKTGTWRPVKDEEWMPIDEMRNHIMGCKAIVYDRTYAVWSPIETWIVSQNGDVCFVQSTMSGESWYVGKERHRAISMIEGGHSEDLPKNRDPISSPIGRIVERAYRSIVKTKLKEPSLLIKNIINQLQNPL